MPAFTFPVGRKLNELDTLCVRPFASNAVHPPRVSLDERIEAVLRMETIELGMDKGGVGEFQTASNQYLQNAHSANQHVLHVLFRICGGSMSVGWERYQWRSRHEQRGR